MQQEISFSNCWSCNGENSEPTAAKSYLPCFFRRTQMNSHKLRSGVRIVRLDKESRDCLVEHKALVSNTF